MRVLIQWATSTAADWVAYEINSMADVRAMPRKPVPSDSPVINDQPGWIAAVNIQGVVLTGDHVGFALDGQGRLLAGMWNDDPDDWAAVPFGTLYTFDSLAPDPALPLSSRPNAAAYAARFPERIGYINGTPHLINTRQTATHYADTSVLQALLAGGNDPWAQAWLDDPARLPWSAWPNFTPNNQLHGVWLSDALHDSHIAARSVRGWREWGS